MEKIQITDINFKALKKSKEKGTTCTVYYDKKYYYKLFNTTNIIEKYNILRLYEELDGITIPKVLFPKQFIMSGNSLLGYTTDNVGAKALASIYTEMKNLDFSKFLPIMKQASEILKNLHKENIVATDLNFSNILIDKQDNVYFCDTDGYSYKGIVSDCMSRLLYNYIYEYRNEWIDTNENTDRLSLLLDFLQTVYNVPTYRIKKQYYEYYNYIDSLHRIQPIFNNLIEIKDIGEIPYLDDILNMNDTEIINRRKQLKVFKKLY